MFTIRLLGEPAHARTARGAGPVVSPYRGTLGVVKEGALADLLLVTGDPTTDLSVVADPERNFVVIMKHGKRHKHALR